MSTFSNIYQSSNKENWLGRSTDANLGVQYWYQAVHSVDISEISKLQKKKVGLVGYACDEGVKRNQGRVGTKDGPAKILQRLGKLPYHHEENYVYDLGSVQCEDEDLESTQKAFSGIISQMLNCDIFPIAIGGGHDIAYAHAKGIISSLPKEEKLGIINFDAHFDLRAVESKGTSGTPFNQLLTEFSDTLSYMVLGIQQSANTKELYEKAKTLGVTFLENYSCQDKHWDKVKNELDTHVEKHNHIYITIDMDGFSSAYAPGVSAPSPLGFTPYFVMKCLQYLMSSNKVISIDIVEVNPLYDNDELTSNLAARLIDFMVGLKNEKNNL